MSRDTVREQLQRGLEVDEYREIRELWKRHSIAEDERDLPGLISTLTSDCVYELPQSAHTWEGHEGAARFYAGLLGAFPDIHFDLTDIVIGPQGVCERARVTGTHLADWLDYPATGEPVEFFVVIFFPWDREQRLFDGETVYVDLRR
ncbi:MAG: nuclear transport factor 2 family protein [Actinobacteria bacterium]|nr:nuclear transport factor 2 family protein [Actinomycetota bacterium]